MKKPDYFLNEDYPKMIKRYKINQLNSNEKNFLKRNTILGHWNFGQIYNSIQKRDNFAVITGFSASGRLHLGNKLALDLAFCLKNKNTKLFVPLSDTEAILTRKAPKEVNKEFNYFTSDLKKWNFDLRNSEIYLHSSKKEIAHLVNLIIKKLEYDDFKKIYGSKIDLSGIFALSNMLADIFYPYQQGYKKEIVILGVDEIKHAKLAIFAAEKMGFPKPSFLFLKILNGLKNEKMSKSKPEQNVLLSDSAEEAKRKIKNSKIRTDDIQDNPLYQIANWILEIDRNELDKISRELKYEEFISFISDKIENKYREINNGKN
jgi:tryptophanyl-tRNA synthetase